VLTSANSHGGRPLAGLPEAKSPPLAVIRLLATRPTFKMPTPKRREYRGYRFPSNRCHVIGRQTQFVFILRWVVRLAEYGQGQLLALKRPCGKSFSNLHIFPNPSSEDNTLQLAHEDTNWVIDRQPRSMASSCGRNDKNGNLAGSS